MAVSREGQLPTVLRAFRRWTLLTVSAVLEGVADQKSAEVLFSGRSNNPSATLVMDLENTQSREVGSTSDKWGVGGIQTDINILPRIPLLLSPHPLPGEPSQALIGKKVLDETCPRKAKSPSPNWNSAVTKPFLRRKLLLSSSFMLAASTLVREEGDKKKKPSN